MSALRFDDVTIRLGGRDILSAASFVVEDGEFIGMLGANGAGKTTLMRAALGLTPVAVGDDQRARSAGYARTIRRSATCRKTAGWRRACG